MKIIEQMFLLMYNSFMEKINDKKSKISAYERALYILGRRDHTEKEMRNKLLRRGHTEGEVATAISSLIDVGLINDEEYAHKFVELSIQKNRGRKRIEYELIYRGVPKDIVRFTIEDLFDSDLEHENALKIARLARLRYDEELDYKERSKAYSSIYGKLARAGFPNNIIKDVLSEVF